MTEEHLDEYPLTRFGAELQRIMNRRSLDLDELGDVVSEAGYPVEPSLLQGWFTGQADLDIKFAQCLVNALGLEREEIRDLGEAYCLTLRVASG